MPVARRLDLDLLPEPMAVCRLPAGSLVPDWATGDFCSITRTEDELSVVCPASVVPDGVRTEGGWRCLKVRGPLAFQETGVLAALASPLAGVGVPIFVLSTFDTDYLLVPAGRLDAAMVALGAAGHRLRT